MSVQTVYDPILHGHAVGNPTLLGKNGDRCKIICYKSIADTL